MHSFLIVGRRGSLARAIAAQAAQAGARVLFCQDGTPLQEELGTLGEVRELRTELQDEAAVEALFDAIPKHLGALHGLIVVIEEPAVPEPKRLADLSLAEWGLSLESPLRWLFWLARATINEFLYEGEGGRIVFVLPPFPASTAGYSSRQVLRPAAEALARSIAKEYGSRGIACNLVAQAPDAPQAGVIATTLFLASPRAAFVNGELISVSL